ncbi:MAG TPA: nucleotidyl transferase AbiEii/AbiGii toxin family protein [Legionella sp.]|nr:nucleotidyl transferase AbiEii/AbiGii toxin family protein [Legionella sp.]
MKSPKNSAASIRQRLLNHSKTNQKPFNEVLQYYAMERFLYRLSLSQHKNKFILKGALMLRLWNAPETRPTMDIDMLGKTSNDAENILQQMGEILLVDVVEDGFYFDAASLKAERIKEDADYHGIRVLFKGNLDTAKIHMQIDIGFGDVVYPIPEKSMMPTILDLPAPELLAYSRETVIAEKFEAMIKLGSLNSRMKDFYDIWMLSRQFDFNGTELAEAIRLTFENRNTTLPIEIEAFSEQFIESKQIQWTAFARRLNQEHVPVQFKDIISKIQTFLYPLAVALSNQSTIPKKWSVINQWS